MAEDVTFTANTYDVTTDRYGYRDFTRETLLDQVASRALWGIYGGVVSARSPHGTYRAAINGILKHLLRIGLSDEEAKAIRAEWADWWKTHEGKVYEQVKLVPLA